MHVGFLQGGLGGQQWRFQHDHRVMLEYAHVMDPGQWLHAQSLEAFLTNDHHSTGAVADLTGHRGADITAIL